MEQFSRQLQELSNNLIREREVREFGLGVPSTTQVDTQLREEVARLIGEQMVLQEEHRNGLKLELDTVDSQLREALGDVSEELRVLKDGLRDLLMGHKDDLEAFRAQVNAQLNSQLGDRRGGGQADDRWRDECARSLAEQQANHSTLQDQFLQFKVQNGSARDEHRQSILASLDAMESKLKAEISQVASEHQVASAAIRDYLAEHRREVEGGLSSLGASQKSALEDHDMAIRAVVAGLCAEGCSTLESQLNERITQVRLDNHNRHSMSKVAMEELEKRLREEMAGAAGGQAAIEEFRAEMARISEEQGAVQEGHRTSQEAALQGLEDLVKRAIERMSNELKATLEEYQGMHNIHTLSFERFDEQLRDEIACVRDEHRRAIDDHHEGLIMHKALFESLDAQLREEISLVAERQNVALETLDATLRNEVANFSIEQQAAHNEIRSSHDAAFETLSATIQSESAAHGAALKAHREGQSSCLESLSSELKAEIARVCQEQNAAEDNQQTKQQDVMDALDGMLRKAIERMSEEQKVTLDEFHNMHNTHWVALETLDAQLREEIARVCDEHQAARDGQNEAIQNVDSMLRVALTRMSEEQKATLDEFHNMDSMHKAVIDAMDLDLREELAQKDAENKATFEELASMHKAMDEGISSEISRILEQHHREQERANTASLEATEARLSAAIAHVSGEQHASSAVVRELLAEHRAEVDGSLLSSSRAIQQHVDGSLANSNRAIQQLDAELRAVTSDLTQTVKSSRGVDRESLDGLIRGELAQVSNDQKTMLSTFDAKLREEIVRVSDEQRATLGAMEAKISLQNARHCALNASVLALDSKVRENLGQPPIDDSKLQTFMESKLESVHSGEGGSAPSESAASQCSLNFSVSTMPLQENTPYSSFRVGRGF